LAAARQTARGDRVVFVYRGRVRDKRPSFDLGVDVLAYMASRPFWQTVEPGYVILIAKAGCPALPALPWGKLEA
jgi:hypothetical protein